MPEQGPNETAVLIVGHGTREYEGTYAFLELVSSVQKQIRSYVQPAFLEITSPSVLEGADHCLSTGAKRLLVVPFFLFSGQDVKKKLPRALEEVRTKNPQLTVTISPAVRPDPRIIEILKERLASTTESLSSPDTGVLLVARGSSDPDATAEMNEIGARFIQETGLTLVRHAFVEIASPSIDDGIQACLDSEPTKIVVLPYLLFPGLIAKKIKNQVEAAQSRLDVKMPIRIAHCLGPHPHLSEILIERIRKEL